MSDNTRAEGTRVRDLYPNCAHPETRIADLVSAHRRHFDVPPTTRPLLFSAPGRTELGGNHTDHNNGKVLASAVQLDSVAAVTRREDRIIRLCSAGFEGVFAISLDDLSPIPSEEGNSSSLIRGVAAGIADAGGSIGGFDASVTSRVLPGSGLSSSASFEILVATILNSLYNDGALSSVDLAKIAQAAENNYFGKPCGLMDQIACVTGGIVAIDFADPKDPAITRVTYSFGDHGLELLVVDTGGNHADLTSDYASVPAEMGDVAAYFGRNRLRGISIEDVRENIRALRHRAGDRAVLRALHYLHENERVDAMVAALRDDDIDGYIDTVHASGDSSWRLLQNCYAPDEPKDQGVTLALTVTNEFLSAQNLRGTCRVHGGGFAGTIQAYIPKDAVDEYTVLVEGIFGVGVVTPLAVRQAGAVLIDQA